MEELREAAMAYYNNGSSDLEKAAWDFFKSMDVNGDGSVSLIEFVEFLRQQGCNWISPNLFTELDRNGDGCLDFSEVLTMYYMVKTRVVCDRCRTILKGLYFTCVVCFDHGDDTYDLCSTCYKQRTFSHQHGCFLDSYVLLRSRRGTSNGATSLNLAQPSIHQPLVGAPVGDQPERIRSAEAAAASEKLETVQAAIGALENVLTVGAWASGGCTIM